MCQVFLFFHVKTPNTDTKHNRQPLWAPLAAFLNMVCFSPCEPTQLSSVVVAIHAFSSLFVLLSSARVCTKDEKVSNSIFFELKLLEECFMGTELDIFGSTQLAAPIGFLSFQCWCFYDVRGTRSFLRNRKIFSQIPSQIYSWGIATHDSKCS